MSFQNTKDALENLKSYDEVPLENVLGLFLDFCDDCMKGGRVDKLPVSDPVDFVRNLRKCNRVMLDIMNAKSLELSDADAEGRTEKQKASLTELENTLAVEEQKLTAAAESVAQQRAALDRRRAAAKEKADKIKAAEDELKAENDRLKRESESLALANVSLQEENLDLQRLIPEREKQKNAMEEKQRELTLTRDALLAEINALSANAMEMDNKINRELEPARKKAEANNLTLTNQAAELTIKIQELKEKNETLQNMQEQKSLIVTDLEKERNGLLTDISETNDNLARLRKEIADLQASVNEGDVSRQEKELEKRKNTLTEAKAALERLTADNESLDGSIKEKEADIRRAEAETASLSARWEELEERESQIKKKLAGVTERTKDVTAVEERLARLLNISTALEADSRILAERTGMSGFSVANDIKNSAQEAENIMRRLKNDIDSYNKEMNLKLNTNL